MTDLAPWEKYRQQVALPAVLAIEWGFVDPDNLPPVEPTPIDRALDILQPYLDGQPL
ncbi:hypothetical protein [Streptomyces jumonjinensis]|uniref:hypothetical protein n=1 Tax=Streptomyces jumonjinensis TaxID=1945 RepID=UPI00379F0762